MDLWICTRLQWSTLAFLFLYVPPALAREGGMGMMQGMQGKGMEGMCPMCGGGGVAMAIVGGLFLLAATAALVALTFFLIRKSRT